MKIDEIINSFELPVDELTQYLTSFMRGQKEIVGSIQGFELHKAQDSDHIYLGLIKPDDPPEITLKAYLCVVTNTKSSYPQIGYTAVAKSHRSQGWMRYLIDWFVHHISLLLTDTRHSFDAEEMWKALIRVPGNLEIYRYNLHSKKQPKKQIRIGYDDSCYPNPWDGTEQYAILAKPKKPHPDKEFQESLDHHHRLSGRVIQWYGISSDGDLINP